MQDVLKFNTKMKKVNGVHYEKKRCYKQSIKYILTWDEVSKALSNFIIEKGQKMSKDFSIVMKDKEKCIVEMDTGYDYLEDEVHYDK